MARKLRYRERWVDCAAAIAAYDRLTLDKTKFKGLHELNPALLARIRGMDRKGEPMLTRVMTEESIVSFAKRCGVPIEMLLANGDGLSPLKVPIVAARPDPGPPVPRFTVSAPSNLGANWKPDPSCVDEQKGYQFTGHFEIEASVECDIACIALHIMRDDHFAICTGPGKASYYNGPVPGEKRKFGYVVIDGEEEFVDADYRFLRIVRAKSGQKLIVGISRWCRAMGMSRDEPLTCLIGYWLEQPVQMLSIESVHAGDRCVEEHVFEFGSDDAMTLARVSARTVA